MDKQMLRYIIRERKGMYDVADLIRMSLDVTERLEAQRLYRFAHTVLLYYSMDDEVDTHGLVASLHRQGRKVLLPRMKDGQSLELVEFRGMMDLRPAEKFNILEPQGEPFTDYRSIDLAIIPGMAFTCDGKRLGRGKGYYDRLLAEMPSVCKIGLCFPFQLVEDVPVDENDILMDEVMV